MGGGVIYLRVYVREEGMGGNKGIVLYYSSDSFRGGGVRGWLKPKDGRGGGSCSKADVISAGGTRGSTCILGIGRGDNGSKSPSLSSTNGIFVQRVIAISKKWAHKCHL